MKNINFSNSVGDHVFLDEEKNPEAKYDTKNYVYRHLSDTEELVNVGDFIPRALLGPEFIICEELIKWAIVFCKKVRININVNGHDEKTMQRIKK